MSMWSRLFGKKRKYDAGSRAPRLAGWNPRNTDADTTNDNPQTLRARSRDLVINSPWANKAVQTIVNNTVGYGIRPQLYSTSKSREKRIADLWAAWAETTACDASGLHDIYGLQRLVMRAVCESGECLIRMRPRRPEDRLPVPMQLQVIEPDYLVDTVALTSPAQGNTVERGIEYDALGRRVAYHLHRLHPGAANSYAQMDTISRVPANEIIHLFRVDRPGQERGVSWLAPVAVTLRELSIFEDALLKKQQLGNLMCGFLISNDPNEFTDELQDIPDLQPGTMYALRPGSEVQFTNPPSVGDDPNYRNSCLRSIAAGIGISYEALTGNLSEVNYSSARLGSFEFQRNVMSWQWTMFIPRFCNRVMEWFLEAAQLNGADTTGITQQWTPPARMIIDAGKEYEAMALACKAGFMSIPEAIRSQGEDPDKVLAEQAEYLAKLDAAGVASEADYRNALKIKQGASNGQSQDATAQAQQG